jgi:predicted transposase/invertase (TIGR01784 family)
VNQTEERTLVSFDWALKNILRDKANFDILEGFLSTLLGRDIRILSLLESEANQRDEFDKYNRVDLLAVDANETILVIELQYTWQAAYLKRILYGAAKLIVENLKLGDSYDKVRKVISVSIVYFPFTDENNDYLYHSQTEFYGINSGKQLLMDMGKLPKLEKTPNDVAPITVDRRTHLNIFPEYYLIEVNHFQNVIQQPIDEWVYLFKNSQVRDDFHSRNIQAAKTKLDLLHMSEKERRAYETFMLSRANSMEILGGQYQLGKEEGKEEGKQEEKRESARRMRAKGFAPAEIMEITGLTEAEILEL